MQETTSPAPDTEFIDQNGVPLLVSGLQNSVLNSILFKTSK